MLNTPRLKENAQREQSSNVATERPKPSQLQIVSTRRESVISWSFVISAYQKAGRYQGRDLLITKPRVSSQVPYLDFFRFV